MFKEMAKDLTSEDVELLDEFERVLLAYKDLVMCREIFESQKKDVRESKENFIVWRAMHHYHERVHELAPKVDALLWAKRKHTGLRLPIHYPLYANIG